MKLIEVSIESVNDSCRRYRKGFVQDMVNEFMHSGMEAAEVTWEDHYKCTINCYKSLHAAVVSLGLEDKVSVVMRTRAKKVYLVRKEDEAT